MIIEYKQRKDSIDISYVDKNNQIAVEELILENIDKLDNTDKALSYDYKIEEDSKSQKWQKVNLKD